jgi:hypothetical protein
MTDIWGWVYDKCSQLRNQGEHDLAAAIDSLPALAGRRRAPLDAIFRLALDRARALDEAWVEVYLRHWRLQGLVFHDIDMHAAMPEAASLIEFCSRPETRDCPQSICAVQDFCVAFGNVDGPGYADDRIGIALDTLARVEPTRSCYACISTELVNAYIDRGEPDKALAFLETDGAHVKAGMSPHDLGQEYDTSAAEIALAREDWAALARHGKELHDFGRDMMRPLGGAFIAIARAHGADEGRATALETLEPWSDVLGHRFTLQTALRAIIEVFEAGLPAAADAALWAGRLRDGCLQLAKDGISANAITRGVAAAPIVARVLGRDAALAILDRIEPELSRLRDPQRLAGKLAAARAVMS